MPADPTPPQENPDGPAVPTPPPMIVLGGVALAWILQQVFPVQLGPPAPELGYIVICVGAALTGWGLIALIRAGNDPRPDKPDAAFVPTGPFRFGRNPIYSGMVIMLTGIALMWGSLWAWLAVGGVFIALDFGVVRREEAYLRLRFGQPYEDYCARVRRWF
jgi:protein-S-isoprenylcysteine O-methyltransferase Ste14